MMAHRPHVQYRPAVIETVADQQTKSQTTNQLEMLGIA
jgi:hypothetical protein